MLPDAMMIRNLSGHAGRRMLAAGAIVGLLYLVLACGRDVTAPVGQLADRATGVTFDTTAYFPIDVQRAARQQYGSSAKAVRVSRHLYGWRAKVGGYDHSIDLTRAVRDQYGPDYVLGAVGVGVYDWRAVHWSALSGRVLPVMPIASDHFFNVESVAWGLANFESVLVTIRNWYASRVGKTFHLLQPLIVAVQSSRTAVQWNALSNSTTDSQHRYGLLYAAVSEYRRTYPEPSSVLRVVIVPFTGNSPDVWLGAAGQAAYAVIPPPRAVSCAQPMERSMLAALTRPTRSVTSWATGVGSPTSATCT